MRHAAPALPESLRPEPVVAGIEFAEGPAFDKDGNLYFVNYWRLGTIGRLATDGTVSVWAESGGQANGLKCDAAGNLVVADYGGRRVTRFNLATRRMEVLTSSFEGTPYLGPNDLCMDGQGNVYFSDPTGSSRQDPRGAVYLIRMDRRNWPAQVLRVAERLAFPNGLAVEQAGRRLFVAESGTNRLLVFDRREDGTLANQRTVMEFPNDTLDGIAFDEAGRLWVARWTNGTIDVVDVEGGRLLASYPAGGDRVTNLCWRGTWLYVTVAGQRSIYRFQVGVRGADGRPPAA